MSTSKYQIDEDDGITSSNCFDIADLDLSNTSSNTWWMTTTGTSGTGTVTGTYPYIFNPYTQAGVSIVNDQRKYTVLELPEPKIPNKVYISGRLVTVGMLGSDVQAAYDGVDKLVISPGELNAIEYNNRITISLDYGEWLYHYNVEGIKDDSNIILAKEVSKVKQR